MITPVSQAANYQVAEFPVIFEQETLPSRVKLLLFRNAKKLLLWARNPQIVDSVNAANAQTLAMETIVDRDQRWQAGENPEGLPNRLMNNACAERLNQYMAAEPGFFEAFVMDQQGALVCMTNRTSDYWQGDEAKWQVPFQKRSILIGALEMDASAERPLVQISLPILSGNKQIIGAITIGKTVNVRPETLQ